MKARMPAGFGRPDMNALMRQAQKMQDDMKAKQAELEAAEYTGSASGEMVTVRMNGKHEILGITIKPEAVDPDDIEMLEDLVAAAVNATVKQVDETAEAEMGKLTGGLNIPGLSAGGIRMGYTAAPLEKLIEQFSQFPGIGRKGATRMAYQVLSMSDADAAALAEAIQNAHTRLHRCRVCQNYTEAELCPICSSAKRDRSTICVVETPRDVQAFERTREYHGLYHVLHGLISPMDGIGAEQLSVKELLARLGSGEVKEVIMAMNPTVEGEATAMYLAKLIKPLGIKTTRLAYGLPVGGSLEYTDETTLYRALSGRDEL